MKNVSWEIEESWLHAAMYTEEEKNYIVGDKISFLNYITVGSDSIVCCCCLYKLVSERGDGSEGRKETFCKNSEIKMRKC